MTSEKPYSKEDYIDAQSKCLDLDVWRDYKEYYDVQESRCDYCGKKNKMDSMNIL